MIGGEAPAPARPADRARLPTGGIRLLNTYGCTETTRLTHAVDLTGPAATPGRAWDGTRRAPIGRALPHVVERLDEQGELLIGGPSLALGHLGLPEATAARFTTLDGERFFRTGDRVAREPHGTLTHQGRLEGELKVRGIRVDPAEVEHHLTGHPEVDRAGCHLRYAAPPTGRRRPPMSTDRTTSAPPASTTPAPAGTEALAAVFRRILEREDVTADSDFFELGGDSLVATRVLSAVARTHGVELTFEDFLLAPTPAGLARRIAATA